MVELLVAFGAGVLATFVPLFVGLFLPRTLSSVRKVGAGPKVRTFFLAFSAGVIFWFFFDVMGEAASLDVNQGFNATDSIQGASHIILALLFLVGVLALVFLDRRYQDEHSRNGIGKTEADPFSLPFSVAAIAAIAIGLHAMGEGLLIGSNLPNSTDLLEAI